MPYTKIEDAPANVRKMDGVSLTLPQINALRSMCDAMMEDGMDEDEAMQMAVDEWKEHNEVWGGKWVGKKGGEYGKVLGYWFSPKHFADTKKVTAWAREFAQCHGIAFQHKDDRAIFYGDMGMDEACVMPVDLPDHPGVKALYAKKIKAADGETMETEDFHDVEIFSVGKWVDSTGKKFDCKEEHLHSIVRAQHVFDAPIKLGHDGDQPLLKTDGLPAAGWVKNLRVAGGKLIGSMVDVPKKIADLIKVNGLKNRSAEIYENVEDTNTGEKFIATLQGLALLGKHLPALNNLSDIRAMYSASEQLNRQGRIFSYPSPETKEKNDNHNGGVTMTEVELIRDNEKLKAENELLKGKVSEFEKQVSTFSAATDELKSRIDALEKTDAEKDSEMATLKGFKANAEAAEAKAAEVRDAEQVKDFKKLLTDKLPPALHEDIVLTFSAADADKRKGMIERYEKMPDAKEFGKQVHDDGANIDTSDNADADESEKKIQEYAKAHGLDVKKSHEYAKAAMAVCEYVVPEAR